MESVLAIWHTMSQGEGRLEPHAGPTFLSLTQSCCCHL